MVNDNDLKYMQQALDLSLQGAGKVNPNPLVGAVLVRDGRVIGEGFHRVFGGPHAEINAIEAAGGSARGATMYVTLEPCNHHGKTPPCTQRIIKEGICRVVVGMTDPNPDVTGNGIGALKDAGVEVTMGILSDQISRTNEVFTNWVIRKRPFVAMKTAMTLDGKIASRTGDSRWISGESSRAFVHNLRHSFSAIMVGVDTVIHDDPSLTDRSQRNSASHPLRIVVDTHGRTPLTAKVMDTALAPTLIALTADAPEVKVKAFQKEGAEIITCPEKDGHVDLDFLMRSLGDRGIDSVLLEGGGMLNFSALRHGIVDKLFAFIAPMIIGGKEAISPVEGEGFEKISDAIGLEISQVRRYDQDVLIEAYIRRK